MTCINSVKNPTVRFRTVKQLIMEEKTERKSRRLSVSATAAEL